MWPVFEYVCSQTKHTAHQTRYCLRILKRCLFSRTASVAQPEHLGGLFFNFSLIACSHLFSCVPWNVCVCVYLLPFAACCYQFVMEKSGSSTQQCSFDVCLWYVTGIYSTYITHCEHTIFMQFDRQNCYRLEGWEACDWNFSRFFSTRNLLCSQRESERKNWNWIPSRIEHTPKKHSVKNNGLKHMPGKWQITKLHQTRIKRINWGKQSEKKEKNTKRKTFHHHRTV